MTNKDSKEKRLNKSKLIISVILFLFSIASRKLCNFIKKTVKILRREIKTLSKKAYACTRKNAKKAKKYTKKAWTCFKTKGIPAIRDKGKEFLLWSRSAVIALVKLLISYCFALIQVFFAIIKVFIAELKAAEDKVNEIGCKNPDLKKAGVYKYLLMLEIREDLIPADKAIETFVLKSKAYIRKRTEEIKANIEKARARSEEKKKERLALAEERRKEQEQKQLELEQVKKEEQKQAVICIDKQKEAEDEWTEEDYEESIWSKIIRKGKAAFLFGFAIISGAVYTLSSNGYANTAAIIAEENKSSLGYVQRVIFFIGIIFAITLGFMVLVEAITAAIRAASNTDKNSEVTLFSKPAVFVPNVMAASLCIVLKDQLEERAFIGDSAYESISWLQGATDIVSDALVIIAVIIALIGTLRVILYVDDICDRGYEKIEARKA